MLLFYPNITDFRCPSCQSVLSEARSNLEVSSIRLVCSGHNCDHSTFEYGFRMVDGCAILISTSQCDTICEPSEIDSRVERSSRKFSAVRRFMGSGSHLTEKNCDTFVQGVKGSSNRARILVIGSGEPGNGTNKIWNEKDMDVYGTDIYLSDTVSTICDAHNLPFRDELFDGVWIQAVLKHVVDPQRVVAEIYRVLKADGLVCSEIPFMQQVHEGAYDFTRFTLSGHRYLFKNFQAVKMDVLGGPSIALSWSFRYWIWSITRSKNLARAANLIMSLIIKPFIFLESKKSRYDSYSGSFFMGKKSMSTIRHKDLLDVYKGNIS